ncbi:hypothetical protein [Leptospira noguchii]|uniref:Uncharacterized protein n=2 Tax=Leptospira noguchii TaxID=28182 RepID=M6Y7C5_9LEPT|nr:hypothetical protein [Leptospira noguchii]EMN02596.1 hypothetical protein LEP1GSC035_2515 [Leptospira noguchii str. 2007001578]EMO87761.1 hypothetical protein LEP1GSC024_4292 [Leptospira noguchii str. 2001034031]
MLRSTESSIEFIIRPNFLTPNSFISFLWKNELVHKNGISQVEFAFF